MDMQQAAEFHNERNRLFARRDGSQLMLDRETYRTMCDALADMEFEPAMRALRTYREAKPYRGFYWEAFLKHFSRDKTAAPASRAAACAPADGNELADQLARRDQSAEVLAFQRLPRQFVQDCAVRFKEFGWPTNAQDRAFRILCIDAFEGRDVEPYRIHRRTERIANHTQRAEMDRQSTIEALRLEIIALEAEIEHLRASTCV